MDFDYNKLRGKIKELFGTQANFSKALGIGRVSLSKKLNNYYDFSGEEIFKSCLLLGIPESEISLYFFNENVQKNEQNPAQKVAG